MKINEIYKYIYYKVYKSMCLSTSWGADWRASAVLLGIELLIPYSLFLYYCFFFPSNTFINDVGWFLLPVIILSVLDYVTFHSNKQWEKIVQKFDLWPRRKNFIGTLIVWLFLLAIVTNFFIAMNLYEKGHQP